MKTVTVKYFLTVSVLLFLYSAGWCQQKDTLPPYIRSGQDSVKAEKGAKQSSASDSPYKTDSATRKWHNPRKATLYSTFLPGLGQIYNRKYWKLPIVYAAVGIPTYTYFYNKSWYQKCQYALAVVLNGTVNNTSQAGVDSVNKVDAKLKIFVTDSDPTDLVSYRNEFRKDQDYSVIFLLLFWGLNILDATVDAHLMNFDVSNDLSMHLQTPSLPEGTTTLANMGALTGLSLVFELHKPHYKPIPLP